MVQHLKATAGARRETQLAPKSKMMINGQRHPHYMCTEAWENSKPPQRNSNHQDLTASHQQVTATHLGICNPPPAINSKPPAINRND